MKKVGFDRKGSRLLRVLGCFVTVLGLLWFGGSPARAVGACSINWTGGAGTVYWTAPGNWDTGALPGASDWVCIPAGATVRLTTGSAAIRGLTSQGTLVVSGGTLTLQDLAESSTASTFTLSGGTLNGDGTLTVTGTFTWSGGVMDGYGTTSIAAGGQLNIPGPNSPQWHRRGLHNDGTATWSGGTISAADGAPFHNTGTFDIRTDGQFTNPWSGAPTFAFENDGILTKTAGTGIALIDGLMGNDGTITVSSGTLRLGDARSVDQIGTFTAGSGARLDFYGGTHGLGPTSLVNGDGTIGFLAGTVNISGGYSVIDTVIYGGTANFNGTASTLNGSLVGGGLLSGAGTLTVSGNFTWSGGTMDGMGSTVIASGGQLNITGTNAPKFRRRHLHIGGTATWSGGDLYAADGAMFHNTGTFDIQTDKQISNPWSGTAPFIFENDGILTKSAGTGVAAISGLMGNDGTISVNSGTLRLAGARTVDQIGTFTAGAGAKLDFYGGTHGLGPASQVNGDGTIAFGGGAVNIGGGYSPFATVIYGGTANFNGSATTVNGSLSNSGLLAGTGVLTATGTFTWSGGGMDGTGSTVIAPGGQLNLTGAAVLLKQRRLENEGTTIWTNGDIYGGYDACFHNTGTFEIQGDRQFWNPWTGTAPFCLENEGILRKTAGSGMTRIAAGAIINFGTVEVAAGTLYLDGPFADFADGTLASSTYLLTGALMWDGADVRTNLANIVLIGVGGRIRDESNRDGLRNLSRNEGSLRLLNGRQLVSTASITNTGTVALGAGSLLSAASTYTQTAGSTELADGTLQAATVRLQGGSLLGSGTVDGDLENAAAVRPGSPAGLLTVTGDYSQGSFGMLGLDLGGLTPGLTHDQLRIGGNAILTGALELNLAGGFTPAPGDTFTLVTYGTGAGAFDSITDPVAGMVPHPAYNPTNLMLTVGTPPDTQPPTWPPDALLTASGITATGLTLSWSPATDDVGVTGYRVYKGSTLWTTTTATAAAISGLTPATAYTFRVEAGDAAGNWSTDGPTASVTTPASPGGTSPVTLVDPLSPDHPVDIPAGAPFPIQFQWQPTGTPVLDTTVSVRIRNAATGVLIAGYTYGGNIGYDNATGIYTQTFNPSTYGIAPGTPLKIMIYFGGKLQATALVNVTP